MHDRLTHVSLDGLTTPLGQAQVLAVSERLQSLGWRCTILSLEPPGVDEATVDEVRTRVRRRGIRWEYDRYRSGPGATATNVRSMWSMLRGVRRESDLLHGRSYFGAALAAAIQVSHGVPYVFDTRGYWVDEKIEAGRWFQDPATLTLARGIERELYRRASGIVCLTELAARDVRGGRFGRSHSEDRAICIPTCVDYERFTMERGEPPHPFLRQGSVVAYVGSLNPSYAYRDSLELARSILERVPSAKFLAMTSQVEEMSSLADACSIPIDRRLITRVPHCQIHRWLPWVDFGLMLLVPPNRAKRASMPTKLAEFFATGVAPISHGANSEVGVWVTRAASGLVIEDLSPRSLDRAVAFVAKGKPSLDRLRRARTVAEEHFSLDFGARSYDALFRDILS